MTRVRSATPEDAAAVAAIYAPEVREGVATFELDPPNAAEMARRMAVLAGRWPWLVAERDGAVAGYAYAGPYHARPGYRWTAELTVYVARAAERRGVARALYAALLATLRAQGYLQAVAAIAGGNAGSIALHRAFGFSHAGTLACVGWKLGRWVDVEYWRLVLGTFADEPDEPRAFRDVGLVSPP